MKNIQLLLLFFTLFLSCSQPSSKGTLAGFPIADPEDLEMTGDTLSLIDNQLKWAIDSQYVAGGVVVIARNNKIVYQKAMGSANQEKTEQLRADHIFRLASMTKPITTTAIMQLVEQGKINLDDPLSKFIPEFEELKVIENLNTTDSSYTLRKARNILTIHHLLTHTSGFAYGSFHPVAGIVYLPLGLYEAWTKDSVTLAMNIPQMSKYPLMHEPGAKFTYGVSIDILGRVVEIVSGLPLDEYFEKYIFEPLGMQDTYFYLPENKSDRLVDVWVVPGTNQEYFSADYPKSGFKTYFSGGAGLCSTAPDYLKFASALLNRGTGNGNRILREETIELMMSNRIDTLFSGEGGEKFGYGGSVYVTDGPYGRKPGRFSWGGAWQTTFWVDPHRNIIAVILTNACPAPAWGRLFNQIEDIVNRSVH